MPLHMHVYTSALSQCISTAALGITVHMGTLTGGTE